MEMMWYKGGKELSASSSVCLEAKGCTWNLVVQQIGNRDAEEHSRETRGQKVSFHLGVTSQLMKQTYSH